jgi:hypothetical protein
MHSAMDPYLIIHAAALATVLFTIAFLILAIAERSIGFANVFGKLIAVWLTLVGLAAVAGALTAPKFGGKPFGLDLPFAGHVAPPAEEPAAPSPPSEPAPEQQPTPSFVQPAPSGN